MPHDAMAQNAAADLTRAAALLRAGQTARAIPLLRKGAARQPGNAAIVHDLGVACLACGRLDEALLSLQRAIGIAPGYADAHLRLGIAFELKGDTGAALAAYRAASRLEPDLADAIYREANLLESLGQAGAAAPVFARGAQAAPGTALGRIAQARAWIALGRDAEAEPALRATLAAEPDQAVALDLLGHMLADLGRFDEARDCLMRAAGAAPLLAGNYYEIARLTRFTPSDGALIGRMRAAASIAGLDPIQRARIHLGLGKAEADLGNYQAAMRHFGTAGELRGRVQRFDLKRFEAQVEHIMECFTRDTVQQAVSSSRQDRTPILIMGLPRSGTTLVEQIISAHPDVTGGGELPFWNEHAPGALAGGGWQGREALSAIAAAYLDLLRALGAGAARVTDKMPLNLLWAGLIHAALPGAMIIQCRRHPGDVALSIHRTHFNVHLAMPTSGPALVGYIRAAERLADHWRHVLPASRFHEISYETLIAEPELSIRALIDACGLEWNDSCLHPDRNFRAVRTASKWQARQPIYGTSVGQWRVYEPWLGPLRALVPAAT